MLQAPKMLPQCRLIEALCSKAEHRRDIEFDFVGHLDGFRRMVCPILGRINVLFPEYTPHDSQYHTSSLFHVADLILGDEIDSMNSVELFLLACSLYGHDWGMAVSDPEKQAIMTGHRPQGMSASEFSLLKPDIDAFARYASDEGIAGSAVAYSDGVPLGQWREYVRRSHAVRSGSRIRLFFEPINTGLGEAAMRICESHSLAFEDMNDTLYPTDFSVLRETANLRAIALYLRLIDLFDLGQDRTPYVLWKFVAPRNPRSAMEWAKHRALQPITCPPYLQGRSIRVDGSTDDHEVYSALEDLRRYCETQLRGCTDAFARMNDPRHKLDIYAVEWRIAAREFTPISIQFEFDRESMFGILTEEVYQGDYYVFLRELLQNSIDAIRFRQAVLKRMGLAPGNVGVISVSVLHQTNGDATITWTDDGIGMDEYVVRNYLAVAGRSYYHSADFAREGITINAISRFGVGILSCFMVADSIKIETFKDPYLPPASPPLKISIPAIDRQFRTEIAASQNARVGTTVTVYVDANKIKRHVKDNGQPKLDVTAYLEAISGFVEFPILVKEDGRKVAILSPYQDTSDAKTRFGEDCQIISLSLGYPWEEFILPQDISTARTLLREKSYDLKTDLGMEGYEGALTYLVPDDDSLELGGIMGNETTVLKSHNLQLVGNAIRWSFRRTAQPAATAERGSRFALYRDGILVPNEMEAFRLSRLREYERPYEDEYEYMGLSSRSVSSSLFVNLTSSSLPSVGLSRTSLANPGTEWAQKIFQTYRRHLMDEYLPRIMALELPERLHLLAQMSNFFDISPEHLLQFVSDEQWPVPLVTKSGRFEFETLKNLSSRLIRMPPELIRPELGRAAYKTFSKDEEAYNGWLDHWLGEPCIAAYEAQTNSDILWSILSFFRLLVGATHHLSSISFLDAPWEGDPPLLQPILEPLEIPSSADEGAKNLLEKATNGVGSLVKAERIWLKRKIQERFMHCPFLADFPAPFADSYAYGNQVLNVKNPKVEGLFRILSKAALSRSSVSLSESDQGRIEDACKAAIRGIPDSYSSDSDVFGHWAASVTALGELAVDLRLVDRADTGELAPSSDEFVPGSREMLRLKLHLTGIPRYFGRPLR